MEAESPMKNLPLDKRWEKRGQHLKNHFPRHPQESIFYAWGHWSTLYNDHNDHHYTWIGITTWSWMCLISHDDFLAGDPYRNGRRCDHLSCWIAALWMNLRYFKLISIHLIRLQEIEAMRGGHQRIYRRLTLIFMASIVTRICIRL